MPLFCTPQKAALSTESHSHSQDDHSPGSACGRSNFKACNSVSSAEKGACLTEPSDSSMLLSYGGIHAYQQQNEWMEGGMNMIPSLLTPTLAVGQVHPSHPHPQHEHHPERAGGRCIQVGLFRGRFSPAPAGTSSWPLAGNTGRPPVPRPPPLRRPQRSRCGSVPGNSSISLLPPRLQETETQAPPLRRGPAEPGDGADPYWMAGPKPSHTRPLRPAPPPAARLRRRWESSECLRADPPAGSIRPAAQHHSRLQWEGRRSNSSLRLQRMAVPRQGTQRGLPLRQFTSGRLFCASPMSLPNRAEGEGGGEQGRGKCRGVRGKLCTPIVASSISQGEIMGTEKFSNLPEVTQPVAADPAANPWPIARGWAGKEEEVPWSRAGSRPAWSRLLTPTHPPPGRSRNVEVGPKGLCPLPVKHPPASPTKFWPGAVERGSPGGEELHITVKWRRCSPHKDQEACQGRPGRTAVGVGRSAAPIGAGEESADPIKPRSRSRPLGLAREPPPASGPHGTDRGLSSLSSQRRCL
ncbi:uncharacterized protein [Symphalangus syndactylus]|uniref:uncharacterized protein n=1 Tax=Symphalangus syndactylus TaxID=9590 RepID=UPI0030055F66